MNELARKFHSYCEWVKLCSKYARWYFAVKLIPQEKSLNAMIKELRKYA
jgi:hypothetical protein